MMSIDEQSSGKYWGVAAIPKGIARLNAGHHVPAFAHNVL